jgi:hypothetical protein
MKVQFSWGTVTLDGSARATAAKDRSEGMPKEAVYFAEVSGIDPEILAMPAFEQKKEIDGDAMQAYEFLNQNLDSATQFTCGDGMKEKQGLSQLPAQPHSNILSFLSAKTLCNVQQTSCRLAKASTNEKLWKGLCLSHWPCTAALDMYSYRKYYKTQVTNTHTRARTPPDTSDMLVLMTLRDKCSKESIFSRAVPLDSMIRTEENTFCTGKIKCEKGNLIFCDESTDALSLNQKSTVLLDVTLFNKNTKQSLSLLSQQSHCLGYSCDCSPYCNQRGCCSWNCTGDNTPEPARPNEEALCFHAEIYTVSDDVFTVQATLDQEVSLHFNYMKLQGYPDGLMLEDYGHYNTSAVLLRLEALHWE